MPFLADTQESELILWLQNNIFPPEEVLNKWKATFKARREALLRTNSDDEGDKAYKYIQSYPFLKQPLGYSLLESDFDQLYEEKKLRLFALWKTVAPKVIEAVKGYARKNSDAAALVAEAEEKSEGTYTV